MANLITKSLTSIQAGSVVYPHISGEFNGPDGYENQVQLPLSANINVGGGKVQVYFNSCSGATTITLRANGADSGLTMTIPAKTTGTFDFTGAPVALSTGDMINYKVDTSGSASTNLLVLSSICLDY